MKVFRRKSIKKKTIINVKQKRRSMDEEVIALSENLNKKLYQGHSMNEITFNPSKELRDLVLFVLKKPIRNQNDILIIRYYLTNFPGFITTLNISEDFNDPQEIMQKISVFIQCEFIKKDTIVCLNGQLGDKFYLIFSGSVGVLIPNSYTKKMTPEEFMGYLINLYDLKEYDLIHKSINSNRKILDSSFKKQILEMEKNCQNITNLSNYKSEEINMNDYIDRLIPKETSNINECMEFTLWKYIKVIDLEEGKSFGDVALKDNFSKRTATIITNEDCYFGIIKKDIYQTCIKDTLDRIRRFNIETILNTKLFEGYSKELFKIYIFNNFKGLSIVRGKYLFKQNEERTEIFFIKSGEFKVELFCSCEDLNNIIESFGGDSYNRDLEVKIKLNNRMKTFNKDKRVFSVFFVKRGDVLGMDDYLILNTNKLFCSVKCFSKNGEYFSIDLDIFNKIKQDLLIKSNYDHWIKIKKKLMYERLIEIKENSLYHFYSLVNEDFFLDLKEEERSLSKNNFKTSLTYINDDINLSERKIPNVKTSFNYMRNHLFPKKKMTKKNGRNSIKSSSENIFDIKSNSLSNNKKNTLKNSPNKYFSSQYENKINNINDYKYYPNLTFGNYNVGKKVVPRLKLYNNIINKLISEKDNICSDNRKKLHKFDMLALDKYIENTDTERNNQKNPNYTKYYTNYYDYINSDNFNKPINLRYKKMRKVVIIDT
jgi:CRP-like cAMP-binding protein